MWNEDDARNAGVENGCTSKRSDAKWRRCVAEKFEIGIALERLMAVQAKLELEELQYEADGTTTFHELHEGQEFMDDVSGLSSTRSSQSRQGSWRSISLTAEGFTKRSQRSPGCMSFQQSGLT